MLLDPSRPVVADANIHLCSHLQQLSNVDLANMIERLGIALVEGETLMMGFAIVVALPDATHASDSNGSQSKNVGGAHIVDIWGDPAAIMQLCQMRCCFVIASNKDGEIGGLSFPTVIVREVAQFAILGRDGHDRQVIGVADGLKVTADDKDIDTIPVALFT